MSPARGDATASRSSTSPGAAQTQHAARVQPKTSPGAHPLPELVSRGSESQTPPTARSTALPSYLTCEGDLSRLPPSRNPRRTQDSSSVATSSGRAHFQALQCSTCPAITQMLTQPQVPAPSLSTDGHEGTAPRQRCPKTAALSSPARSGCAASARQISRSDPKMPSDVESPTGLSCSSG